MSLGTRIKECRLKSKLSQEKVAELVGVSRQAVTKWESGLSAPNTENLFALAKIFGTTVDYLASSEESQTQSTAEQIYQLYKEDMDRKALEKKTLRLRRIQYAGLIAVGFLAVFLLGKLLWADFSQMTFTSWLLGTDPKNHDYLFGWVLGKNLFLICSMISVLPALFGKHRFSLVTLAGFTMGLPLGEYLGRNPEGSSYGYGHYGWAIWAGIFLLSVALGIWLQRFSAKDCKSSSRKFRIFCVVSLIGVLLIVLVIRLNMFIPATHS